MQTYKNYKNIFGSFYDMYSRLTVNQSSHFSSLLSSCAGITYAIILICMTKFCSDLMI